jgi:nucleoside-diphosphate-sugar epimerase
MQKKTALVVGATGIIGRYILKHILDLEDWNAVGVARRIPADTGNAPYVSLDLLNYEDTVNQLKQIEGVTHIFYAAYQDFDALSPEQIEVNTTMLKIVVQAVEVTSNSLERVVLMQGAKVYGVHLGKFKTPAKETDPRHMPPNFYYSQEDFLRSHQEGKSWTWTILRPDVVAGLSLGNPMNIAMVIAVYAAISKELGLPLRFPGKEGAYHALAQVTDASLLARGAVWAATEEQCSLEIFNITNGDFFRWEQLWPTFAEFFEMEYAPLQTISLADMMPLQKHTWEEMVSKYNLQSVPFEKVAAWPFGDFVFGCEFDVMSDTTKIKQFGFTEVLNSEEMFLRLLQEFKAKKIIP